MEKPQSPLDPIALGMYEKALSKDLSWHERLALAGQANYDFVEMSIDETEPRIQRLNWTTKERTNLQAACRETGVPIKSLSLSSHRSFPLGSEDKSTRQTALALFRKSIDLSADLGIRYILLSGADIYYEDSTEQTQALFLDGLEQGIRWAAQAGVMLALENWDIRIDSLTKVMRYVNHFNSPWLQAYADIGNLAYAGYDVLSELEVARGHIAAVHVKDTQLGQLRYVYPGEGIVPFVESFTKLAELNFQGSIVLELWTENFPDALVIATAGNKWIRAQMQKGWNAYLHKKDNNK